MADIVEKAPEKTKRIYTLFLIASLICLFVTTILLYLGYRSEVGPYVILMFVFMAFSVRASTFWSVTGFTLWVTAFVTAAMFYPGLFTNVGE